MTIKMTKKSIINNYTYIVNVPYCEMQNLLKNGTAMGHVESKYGWDANVYLIGSVAAIVTGYRLFGAVNPSAELMAIYDAAAADLDKALWRGEIKYAAYELGILQLQAEFVQDAIHEYRRNSQEEFSA